MAVTWSDRRRRDVPLSAAAPNAVAIITEGVTLSGFTIHRPAEVVDFDAAGVMIGGLYLGYGVAGETLGTISNNTVRDCRFSQVWKAVTVWHSSSNTVEDNTVAALGNTGAWAAINIFDGSNADEINLGFLSKDNVIQGNTLADKGIGVGAYEPPIPTDNSGTKILDNTVRGDIGFYCTASSDVEISGNTVAAGPYSAGQIVFHAYAVSSFTSCVVNDNTARRRSVRRSSTLQYDGWLRQWQHRLRPHRATASHCYNSNGVAITGNSSTDNGASGIVLADTSNVTVRDNLILRNAGNADNPGGLTLKARYTGLQQSLTTPSTTTGTTACGWARTQPPRTCSTSTTSSPTAWAC